MVPEIPELDDEETFRPLQPHDKEVLSDKRFEKMDLRLHRIETMLQQVILRLNKVVEVEQEICKNHRKEKKPGTYGEPGNHIEEKLRFLERHEIRMMEQAKKLSEQEQELMKIVKDRREEDCWFNMIMHECKFKVSDRESMKCIKTNKVCNFRNCPRKDELKEFLTKDEDVD
ncbi:TPA: hypothetical protein HA265_01100 [Candidatus Woesearchaeota archaeon]|nr:hypothetical protein [Candidatus Woesearchaeota archaeon]